MTTLAKNPVGRPRGFDEDQVLDAVMAVFWRQGYEGTSMADLLEATGLHKGSLYQAFGDKHALFVRALRRYIANLKAEMSGVLMGAPTAFEGIRNAMHKVVNMCMEGEHGGSRGCMALNTLVEKGISDPEIQAVLEGAYATRMNMITQSVRACQAEGSMRGDWPAERIASMIEAVETGLAATLKGAVPREHAHQVIDDLLNMLKTPAAA